MGVLDYPMFSVVKPRLEIHAEKCVARVKKHAGVTLKFRWKREDGMCRLIFLDKDGKRAPLKDFIKYSLFPKYSQISARKFIELVYLEADESVLRSPDFVAFTSMMIEDFDREQIEGLVKAFPWLLLINSEFQPFEIGS